MHAANELFESVGRHAANELFESVGRHFQSGLEHMLTRMDQPFLF
jgi:hypothetical protein